MGLTHDVDLFAAILLVAGAAHVPSSAHGSKHGATRFYKVKPDAFTLFHMAR